MKNDKIKYSFLSSVIFIIFNIIIKFLMYGNDTIWMNYMPPLSPNTLSPGITIFKHSIYKMIPFIIINIFAIAIYTRKMYNKKIYNKKIDVIFPILMLVIILFIIYFLISRQYSICV